TTQSDGDPKGGPHAATSRHGPPHLEAGRLGPRHRGRVGAISPRRGGLGTGTPAGDRSRAFMSEAACLLWSQVLLIFSVPTYAVRDPLRDDLRETEQRFGSL